MGQVSVQVTTHDLTCQFKAHTLSGLRTFLLNYYPCTADSMAANSWRQRCCVALTVIGLYAVVSTNAGPEGLQGRRGAVLITNDDSRAGCTQKAGQLLCMSSPSHPHHAQHHVCNTGGDPPASLWMPSSSRPRSNEAGLRHTLLGLGMWLNSA
jgi:hypothetical protein